MTNHILIGLGGTGGKVLAAFRRAIYELEGGKTPPQDNVEYLYVDSNPEYMDMDHVLWRVPGDSLFIGQSATLNIQGKDLKATLANLHSYPAIQPWIGSESRWSHIQSAIGEGIGGQKRRLGRFLFACQASDFVNRVRACFDACKERTKSTEVIFHIICGLAGGTGSGSVVDAIALIRKNFSQLREHRIFVYCLLPDRVPPPGWLRPGGAYHANGYAALQELNALAVGAYKPFDLTGRGERIEIGSGAYQKSSGAPPFDGCYVFTNENEANRTIEIGKDGEFYKVIGGFLYQKIVAVEADAWREKLSRYETMENMISDPSEAEGGIPVRSTRFASFGMKRLVIPEREIREYLIYCSAEQALLQSLYNHIGDKGYQEFKAENAPPKGLKIEDLLANWRMSPSHLLQETTILELPPNSPQYKDYRKEWNLAEALVRQVKENVAKPVEWLSELRTRCEKFYNQDFRGVGVHEFFGRRSSEIGSQVREIMKRVEEDLFTRWHTGEWGLQSCEETLQMAAGWIQEQRKLIATRLEEAQKLAGSDARQSELESLIVANAREWGKIGPLAARFGKREELLHAQAEIVLEFYRARMFVLACQHAERLLRELADRFRELLHVVQEIIVLHKDALNGSGGGSDAFFGVRNHKSERCNPEEAMDPGAPVIKYYEPQRVREFAVTMFGDRRICETFAANFRNTLSGLLSGEKSLSLLRRRLNRGNIMDALTDEKVASKINIEHTTIAEQNKSLGPVLGENIVDKLAKNYAGQDVNLQKFCGNLLSLSGTFLKWDDGQRLASGEGLKRENDQWVTSVMLPRSPNSEEFRGELEKAFTSACSSKGTFYAITGRKPQEIVIISMRNMFPLRYSWHVGELRRLYEEFLAHKNSEREREEALMELTSEDCEFPPLFPLTREERENKYLPSVLVALCAGLIKPQTDPITGRDILTWMPGDRAPKPLGADTEEILEKLGTDVLVEIHTTVVDRKKLAAAAEKQTWIGKLNQELAALEQKFSSALDPKRQKLDAALRKAIQLIS